MTLQRIDPGTAEWDALKAELSYARLPTDDLLETGQMFFGDGSGGYGGLHIVGANALVRSVVISPTVRRGGHGRRILEGLASESSATGVTHLWLLTNDQAAFFKSCGFEVADRSTAPEAIRETRQFAGLCPATATFMRREV